ncbi:MAG TPA: hypothetical protein VGJ66_15620 [Pyrinomonadaceae bacterium]
MKLSRVKDRFIRRMTLVKHGGRDARGPSNDGPDPLDVIGVQAIKTGTRKALVRHAKPRSGTRKHWSGTRKPRSSSFKSGTRLCSCTDVASDGSAVAFS